MVVENHNSIWRVASFFALVVAFQIAVARFSLEREAKRRFQHALTGHALVQISYFLPIQVSIAALAVGSLAIWYVRYYQDALYQELFGPLLRPDELKQGVLPGAFYFIVGTLVTAILFPLDIARYAVECLAFADPLASFVGKSISSPTIHESASVAGCLTCFTTALVLGKFVFEFSWNATLVASAACTIAEAFPMINDNLSIPLATAAALNWMKP